MLASTPSWTVIEHHADAPQPHEASSSTVIGAPADDSSSVQYSSPPVAAAAKSTPTAAPTRGGRMPTRSSHGACIMRSAFPHAGQRIASGASNDTFALAITWPTSESMMPGLSTMAAATCSFAAASTASFAASLPRTA